MGGLGGFGGLFDLKAAGFKDPILVSGTDGVGTKLKVAIEARHSTTRSASTWWRCASTTSWCRAPSRCSSSTTSRRGKLDVEAGRRVVEGIAEAASDAGCALIGGETAEMPGMYAEGDYDLAGFTVGAVERDALLPRARHRARATSCSAWPRAACIPTATRWCARS